VGRYIIFHNPISGTGRAARLVKTIAAELQSHGHAVDDYCSTSREDAIRAAGEVDTSYDAVLGVGGDGTQNSLVSGLIDRQVPLLPVPAGTENVLCKAIGVPSDPVLIRQLLEAGQVRSLDVGMANEQPFAVMSGVGFDATVTGEVHAKRCGPIKRHYYYWPTLRNLLTYKWPRLTVEVDGRTVADCPAMAIIGNMKLYADRLHICSRATPEDGLLDICIFLKPGALQLVSYFASVKLGTHMKRDDVVYCQSKRIVVRSDGHTPFQVDGDAVGHTPIEYTVRPKAIRMFVGQGF
jgi:YegS/Rv2252/BmrU family lipid kinase